MSARPNGAGCCAALYELPIVEYLLGPSFHPGGARLTRELASAALISRESSVLDVACGNGSTARLLAADFGARVTGCDHSISNLRRAALAARAGGRDDRTGYIRCDAEQLPFAPESFDVCVCECSLCLFENIDTALEQMRRTLTPGGRIGISDFFLNAAVPASLDTLLGRVLCITGAQSIEQYRAALARAGFAYIRTRRVTWALDNMIKRVRERLRRLQRDGTGPPVPAEWGDPVPVLAELERFIANDGAGYLIATARRS